MASPERDEGQAMGVLPGEEASSALVASIWPLLGRHIAFHRRLVDLTANVKAALLLSQAIYWTGHGRDIHRRDGWFHKTADQWAMETGLSVKEQTNARELLRMQVLLEEQRQGLPARMHFRLNLDELGRRLAERVDRRLLAIPGTDWHDRLLIAELLGPAVAFHRVLASVAGGVHGGLLLSRALHLTRLQARRQRDMWIADSAAHWFQELGLSRREQEAARRDLLRAGIWEERVSGIPSSLSARVRLAALAALLRGGLSSAQVGAASLASVCGSPASSTSPNGETRLRESRSLVSPKPPCLVRPNRHHCLAESAILQEEQSTSGSLQPQNTSSPPSPPAAVDGGAELTFPEQMLPDERQAARVLLRPCGDHAQALLDELAGRLQMGGVRSSPVAYLRGLIARAGAGSFVPELGPRVAAARFQRQKEAALRREREAEERRLAAERATPEYQARARAQREQVRQMLGELKARMGTGRQP